MNELVSVKTNLPPQNKFYPQILILTALLFSIAIMAQNVPNPSSAYFGPETTFTLDSAAGTDAQTVCSNTGIKNITYAGKGSPNATITGLPQGVTGSWDNSSIYTIKGTPTVSGTFKYTLTLSDGSGTVSKTGTITVTPNNTVSVASSQPTICNNNTALANIFHSTTGATGIGTAVGLPLGVTAIWSENILTISGNPSETGTFKYSIPLTGGCGNTMASGTITINALPTITGASISQPATIYANSIGNSFSISPVPGATSYEWTVAGTGWAITAGENSTTATITAGSDIGIVYVTATNSCGTSPIISSGIMSPADGSRTKYNAGDSNYVLIACQNQQIKIKSEAESIDKIFIYDMLEREIYRNTTVNSNNALISHMNNQQILIVTVVLADGQAVCKKVAF